MNGEKKMERMRVKIFKYKEERECHEEIDR